VDRSRRALSFGEVAEDYDRFRPAPPEAALDWLLPEQCRDAVDVGAGTGALTRLLVQRVERVTAVEPDARMRAVLIRRAPAAIVLDGRAEALPLPDAYANAVLVSSAWHWIDPERGVAEVARVLRPGGILGLLWANVDSDVPWVGELWRSLCPPRDGEGEGRRRRESDVTLPAGAPFSAPETRVFRFAISLTPADLVGLVSTYSGVITLPPRRRAELRAHAGQLVAEHPRLAGRERIVLPFACRCWRARRA
jgi:SAM-dependent methyltransferase